MCVELGGIGGKKRRVLWRASNRPRVLSNGTRQVAFMMSLRMCNRDTWRWKFSQLTLRFGTRLCARNALPLTTSAPETAAIVSCTGGAGRRRRGDEWTLGLKSLGCGESVRKNPSWISQITFLGTAPSDLELLDNRSMDKTCPKWLCRASREAKSQKSQRAAASRSLSWRDPLVISRSARGHRSCPARTMTTVPEYNVHARKKEHPRVYAVRGCPERLTTPPTRCIIDFGAGRILD